MAIANNKKITYSNRIVLTVRSDCVDEKSTAMPKYAAPGWKLGLFSQDSHD